MQAGPVKFAIYQQGPNAENKLVGIVTLDETKDEKGEYGKWTTPAGESTDPPTLIVGEEENQVPYEVTYQVTDGFAQLVIEGLPRYDEHGYTYEYIALEVGGSAEQTTQIDADGNYITDVVNGPGRGLRIMLRKRWVDNSDIEHREPVKVEVYYHDEANLENDVLLATVTLGEPGEPWYELVGLDVTELENQLGDNFPATEEFYKHLYIREVSIGDHKNRTTQDGTGLSTGSDGAVVNNFVDQIAATNHTYEATYTTQLGGLTVEEGEDTPGISDPLFIVTNRRLGNVDLTVTKEWQDGGQLQESLKGSNVVPVVKLVFDEEKNNAEPMEGTIEEAIDYTNNTVQIGNEAVEIKGKEEDSREEAIQPLLEDEGLIEELYFYNLPKYDNQGRVARYKVVELWTTKDNIENGKVKKVDECYELENFLNYHLPESTSDDLKSLLSDLSVSYREDSYEEKDEQKQNDEQKITITNKLTGTKEIKFYKEWNDQYALEHGKRPDLYLTLYQTTKGSGKMQLYADHSWDKQALTISEDGGENAAQAEKETDENYWICTFPDLPKYDEKGDEYIYYAVERLTVNDPSDFDYAPAQFKHGSAQGDLTVEYDEDGKVVELPSVEVDNHRVLIKTDESGDVALLEGGTFVNSLEEAVTISGRKLWDNVPLTADSADLPTVTFEVYQYLESEVPTEDLHENLDPNLKVATREIKSEEWENLKTDDNQYEFKFDGMEGKDGNTVPFPLYNDKGQRYVYVLHEVTDKVSDTDWDLVYQDPVYNEYQITNTYDPQLGALSVKKLLQVDARWPSGQYPAITMFLERGVMENGNWVKDDTYQGETIVWTSTQVEEAAKKAVESNPSEQTVVLSSRGTDGESIFLFKNLEMYAPNGEAYYYRVVEQLDNMHYEAAVVSENDSSQDSEPSGKGNINEINKVFEFGDKADEQAKELATKPLRPTKNEGWSNGSNGSEESDGNVNPEALTPRATFGDQYPEGETITLKVTKEWLDNNDALELRPESATFIESLSVWRKADGQGVTGGAEAIPEQRIKVEIIATDDQADNHYTYTITGKDGEDLEKIAPNGMPWIYVVKEESTGTTWEAYILTDEEGKEITEVSKSAKDAENGVLTLPEMHNHLTVTHTFTKNWENAGDDNLTWENIGVEEMDVTGTLYVGVMENGTLTGTMTNASDFFEGSQWEAWFENLGGLGDEEGNYKFEKSQTIDVGSNTTTANSIIKFENLPLVQKNEDDTTNQLVYVVAETKVAFTVNEKNYTQSFTPTFTADGGNLTITYTAGHLTQDEENVSQSFFTPSDVTISLSNLSNKTSSSSSATNAIDITELTIKKIWKDNNDAEKLRPELVDLVILKDAKDEQEEVARADLFASRTITTQLNNVVLRANGEPYTVNISGDGSVTVSDLPSVGFDEQGNLITYQYTVRELRSGWQDDDILNEDDILKAGDKYNPYYTVSYDDNAHTVTNTLTHMDITAVKAWKPEGLHGDYAEVTFELQSRVEGAGDWSMVNIEGQENPVILDGTPDGDGAGAGEFEAWKARWTELPRTDSSGAAIEYLIKETLASDLIENEHVTILYPEKGITGSTADKTYTVTNIPLGQITVTKEDGDGNGLAGVEFTLTGGSDGARKVTTDASGEAIFDKLPLYDEQGNAITYTLTESSTPDDYIQLDEEINVSFTAADQPNGGIYWETTDGKYLLHEVEYEVVNGQYFQVVHTGGSGFYWPGVLGAGAAAAGVLYLIRRKTKGHNTEQ